MFETITDQSAAVRGGLKKAGRAFLLTPFTHDTLLHAIRQQLEGARNTGTVVTGTRFGQTGRYLRGPGYDRAS